MINHRKTDRSATEIDVRLYEDTNLLALAKAKNHTSTGMFILTNSLLHPKGSSLNVSFEESKSSGTCSYTAKVIHRTINGIGVQFQSPLPGNP